MGNKITITEQEKKAIIDLYYISEQNMLTQLWNRGKAAFDDTPCSTDKTDDAKNWKEAYDILVQNRLIKNGQSILILWGPTQTMYYTNGKSIIKEFKVSTGYLGFANTGNSGSTGFGLMKISNKIRAPKKYQVIVNKVPSNMVLGPNTPSTRKDAKGDTHDAEILTGILELQGLDQCNKNIYSRNIYIHGTNKENELGGKHSNGCIRVSNDNIIYLLNTIPVGTKLFVRP